MTGIVFLLTQLVAVPYADTVAQLDRLNDEPELHRAVLAMTVHSLKTGEIIYEHNANKLLLPASTQKLITAAAALDVLGGKRTFVTRWQADAPIATGHLAGDLYWVGGGDPSLGDPDPWETLRASARALKAGGLRQVDGRLVVDTSIFAAPGWGQGWAWDDLVEDYAAPVSGLPLGRNAVPIAVEPAPGAGQSVQASTPMPECLPLRVDAVTRGPMSDTALLPLSLFRGDGVTTQVVGEIMTNAPARTLAATMPDPARCAGLLAQSALAASGIIVTGGIDVATSPTPAHAHTLYAVTSPPLADLLRVMLKDSVNIYAEAIARQLDERPSGKTFAAARVAIEGVLRRAAVAPDAYRLIDGSGLSRYNRITATAQVRLLRWVWGQSWRNEFVAMLPVAAVDGTMRNRGIGGPAARVVSAKTGSMSGVLALAGYLITASGEPLAFAMMSEGVAQPGSVIQRLQDQALEILVSAKR